MNTLVLEPGYYGFNDFVKVGLPLLVLTLIVTVAMVGVLYPFLKDEPAVMMRAPARAASARPENFVGHFWRV